MCVHFFFLSFSLSASFTCYIDRRGAAEIMYSADGQGHLFNKGKICLFNNARGERLTSTRTSRTLLAGKSGCHEPSGLLRIKQWEVGVGDLTPPASALHTENMTSGRRLGSFDSQRKKSFDSQTEVSAVNTLGCRASLTPVFRHIKRSAETALESEVSNGCQIRPV